MRLPSTGLASRQRWTILVLLTCFTTIGYIERVNLTVAARSIRLEFGLSDTQLGYSFSIFLFAYTLCQVPAGLLIDRYGSRRVLAVCGLLWFLITIGLGFAAGEIATNGSQVLAALIVGRFCLGLVEAPTYPGTSAAIRRWFPPAQRGLPNATTQSSSYVGEALTLAILGSVTAYWGWRYALYLSAVPALAIAFVLWRWAADGPEELEVGSLEAAEPSDNPDLASGGRRGQLLFLSLAYGFHGYVSYLFFFWFFIYLVDARGFSLSSGGLVGALPSIAAAFCTMAGGFLSDRLTDGGSSHGGRKQIIAGAGIVGAVAILVGAYADNVWLAVGGFVVAVGTRGFVEGAFWSMVSSIGGRRTGFFGGVMNMAANFGGIVSTVMAPMLVARFGWSIALLVAAIVCALTSAAILALAPILPDAAARRADHAYEGQN